jgi:hypothetical protein
MISMVLADAEFISLEAEKGARTWMKHNRLAHSERAD